MWRVIFRLMNNDAYSFRVKFDSSEHSIDTETYVQALISLTTLLKEVNYQLGGGERISVNVIAEEPGSFDVTLLLKAVQHLFSNSTVAYLSSIMGITTGLVTLKKLHKKTDPEKTIINGDDVTIKDNDGTVLYQTNRTTFNIYVTNQVVQDALADNFRSLEKDEKITGFEINADETSVRADREEFSDLAERVEIEAQDKEISDIPAHLIIVKLVFEGEDRKWDFLYNGVKISATVLDKNFWDTINSGEKFSKGDELIADLRIIREFDPNVSAFINKDYQVMNVREHHPREFREQSSLEGMNE